MNAKAKLLSAALLAALFVPDVALAQTVRASGNVPLRSGPGSGYPVIAHLANGERVPVLDCTRQSRWCLVEGAFGRGWARGSYLVGGAAKSRVTPFEFSVNPFPWGHDGFFGRNRDDD